jgi:hypothetical protein
LSQTTWNVRRWKSINSVWRKNSRRFDIIALARIHLGGYIRCQTPTFISSLSPLETNEKRIRNEWEMRRDVKIYKNLMKLMFFKIYFLLIFKLYKTYYKMKNNILAIHYIFLTKIKMKKKKLISNNFILFFLYSLNLIRIYSNF